MRQIVVIALMGLSLAACVSRTVEERPVVVQQPQPTNTMIVPPGSTITPP
jgi:hypothetical protein